MQNYACTEDDRGLLTRRLVQAEFINAGWWTPPLTSWPQKLRCQLRMAMSELSIQSSVLVFQVQTDRRSAECIAQNAVSW